MNGDEIDALIAAAPYEASEQLEPMVARVLARNPSPYTFTGTQTYVVGENDVAIIDPGPDEADHLDGIIAAIAGRPVRAIICTHTHRDHSPASGPLAKLTHAPIIGCAPLVLHDDGPRADSPFDESYAPDRVLIDGEQVTGHGWTLEAVATPGHTSNHLCIALKESGALFTGDHVMGWSTTVIAPPDGDMADYMASMAKLLERDDRIYYPAHGPAVDKPHKLVRGMMGHRKQREGQILRLLGRGLDDIPEMVTHMYKGLDPRLTGAAGRSVLAHMIDLKERGIVVPDGEKWRLTNG